MVFNLLNPLSTIPTEKLLLWCDPTVSSSIKYDIGFSLTYISDLADLVPDAASQYRNDFYLIAGATLNSSSIYSKAVYVSFDGVDDYMGQIDDGYSLGDGMVINLSQSFSWNTWINLPNSMSAVLLGQGEVTASGHYLEIILSGSSQTLQIQDQAGTTKISDYVPVASWVNVTYTKSTAASRPANVYINAVKQTILSGTATTASQAPTDAVSFFNIGRVKSGSFLYNGALKQIGPTFVYQKELSELEVKMLYGTIRNRLI